MDTDATTCRSSPGLTSALTLALAAGFTAAWLSTSAVGLLGHALRHALTWLSLGTLLVAAFPGWRPLRDACGASVRQVLGFLFALAALVGLTAPNDAAINILAVPVAFSLAAALQDGPGRRALRAAAQATAAFALYRMLHGAVPAVWSLADGLASGLGALAGHLAGRPLNVGATFAGLDYLVLMAAWTVAWSRANAPPHRRRALLAALAIMFLHLLYLLALARVGDLIATLPKVVPDQPDPFWIGFWRQALPWQVPALALPLHLLAVIAMARWVPWEQSDSPLDTRHLTLAAALSALMLAAALGLSSTLVLARAPLEGKTIVISKEGFLNWLKPEHGEYGRLSIGMYGLLPHMLKSLGANCRIAATLSDEELRGADALVLIFPDDPWQPGQLERIQNFVRNGGSLWVLGEHTVDEKQGGARFNDVLAPSGIQVKFDSATFAVGGWLESYDALRHPATLGIPDSQNQFGLVIGASLACRWPAQPLIAGRWGWSDWGDHSKSSMMGNGRYDAGERLGDLILVAERPFGKGTIVAFGDTSSLSNGINIGSYPFTARLFAYLAGHPGGPHTPARAALTTLLALLLGACLLKRTSPAITAAAFVMLGIATAAGTAWTVRRLAAIPDGHRDPEYALAYVDHAHLGRFSGESWREEGLMGLQLALMRNHFLTLALTEFTPERLAHAAMLVSVAPSRPYTARELAALRRYIEAGGIFILTVGREDIQPARNLLDEFGFDIGDGTTPTGTAPGPAPFGFFKAPYFNAGDYMSYVRFFSAWPVFARDPEARVMAYGAGDTPSMLMRRIGSGKMLVVGDTAFAMNKNLEIESGAAFEGLRENPDFWRWLITDLREQPHWTPPDPRPAASATHAAPPAPEEPPP